MTRPRSAARAWDFSPTGRARVVAITLGGVLFSMSVAMATVSYTTEFMASESRLLTWIAAIGLPVLVSGPVFYLFANKLRQLAILHRELQFTASHDQLTGCLARGAFVAAVTAWLARNDPKNASAGGGLLVIDADHFKHVNDEHGHMAGDEALRLIAKAIVDAVRTSDLVGRIGGEEFAVFLPNADFDHAKAIAERIRANIDILAFAPAGHPHALSVSVGGVMFSSGAQFSDLFRSADARLYAAKSNGRNRVDMSAPVFA